MKIKFTTSVAGSNFAYREGQVVDLREDIAKEFIRCGQAVKAPREKVPGIRQVERGGQSAETAAHAGDEKR